MGCISTEFELKRKKECGLHYASVMYVMVCEKSANLAKNRCMHNRCWGGLSQSERCFRGVQRPKGGGVIKVKK